MKGAAVIDPNHRAAPIVEILDMYVNRQWQSLVCRGHRMHVVGFAIAVVRFRGSSVFEVRDSLLIREVMYMDLATLMVELGVSP